MPHVLGVGSFTTIAIAFAIACAMAKAMTMIVNDPNPPQASKQFGDSDAAMVASPAHKDDCEDVVLVFAIGNEHETLCVYISKIYIYIVFSARFHGLGPAQP